MWLNLKTKRELRTSKCVWVGALPRLSTIAGLRAWVGRRCCFVAIYWPTCQDVVGSADKERKKEKKGSGEEKKHRRSGRNPLSTFPSPRRPVPPPPLALPLPSPSSTPLFRARLQQYERLHHLLCRSLAHSPPCRPRRDGVFRLSGAAQTDWRTEDRTTTWWPPIRAALLLLTCPSPYRSGATNDFWEVRPFPVLPFSPLDLVARRKKIGSLNVFCMRPVCGYAGVHCRWLWWSSAIGIASVCSDEVPLLALVIKKSIHGAMVAATSRHAGEACPVQTRPWKLQFDLFYLHLRIIWHFFVVDTQFSF
jgi:hypothetical protein